MRSPHPTLRGWFIGPLNGVSQVFLQRHPGCGALLLLAIFLGAPSLLPYAVLGTWSAWLIARCLGASPEDLDAGLYGYNGCLLGLLLGLRLEGEALLPLFVIAAAGLSSLVMRPLLRASRRHDGLPVYTSPFVALGWISLWLAGLLPPPQPDDTPWPQVTLADGGLALLRSFGQVIFLDSPAAGACVLAALALASWRVAAWALLGAGSALLLGMALALPHTAVMGGLFGLNGVLIAIALGQGVRSLPRVLLGVGLGLLLQPGFAALGLPAMTAPFILACWLVLAGGRLLRDSARRTAGNAHALRRARRL